MAASLYKLSVVKVGVSTAAATYQLFSVLGGRVLLQLLYGHVTTAPGAGAAVVTLNSNPTVGADSALSIASGSLALAPIGTLISLTGNVAAAPAVSAGQGAVAAQGIWLIVQPGAIEAIVAVGDATGVIDWFCRWEPLDPGARVVAA